MKRARALAWFAKQWVGFVEEGGANKGQVVQRFQMAVDGKAQGEPWCMSFVQFCLGQVDDLCDELAEASFPRHELYRSEHVLTTWARSPNTLKRTAPSPGWIAIWQKEGTSSGHAGIVVDVIDEENFLTVEGNTSASKSSDQREGEGVYLKTRHRGMTGDLALLGFLKPWSEDD